MENREHRDLEALLEDPARLVSEEVLDERVTEATWVVLAPRDHQEAQAKVESP